MGGSSTLLIAVFAAFTIPVAGIFWPTLDAVRPFALPKKMAHPPREKQPFPQYTGHQGIGGQDIPRSWILKSGEHIGHILGSSSNQAEPEQHHSDNPGDEEQYNDHGITHDGHLDGDGHAHHDHLSNHGSVPDVDLDVSGHSHDGGLSDTGDTQDDKVDDHADPRDIHLDISWHIQQLANHEHTHDLNNDGNPQVDPLTESKGNHDQRTDNHEHSPDDPGIVHAHEDNGDVLDNGQGELFKAGQFNDEPIDQLPTHDEHDDEDVYKDYPGYLNDTDDVQLSEQESTHKRDVQDLGHSLDVNGDSQEHTYDVHLDHSGHTHDVQVNDSGQSHGGHLHHTHKRHLDEREHTHDVHQDDRRYINKARPDDRRHGGHPDDRRNIHKAYPDDRRRVAHPEDRRYIHNAHSDDRGHNRDLYLDDRGHTREFYPDDRAHSRDLYLDDRGHTREFYPDDHAHSRDLYLDDRGHTREFYPDDHAHSRDLYLDDRGHTREFYPDDHAHSRDLYLDDRGNTGDLHLDDHGHTRDLHLDDHGHTRDLHLDDRGHTRDLHLDDHGHTRDLHPYERGHTRDLHPDDRGHTRDLHPDDRGHTRDLHPDDRGHTRDLHPDDRGHTRDLHPDERGHTRDLHPDERGHTRNLHPNERGHTRDLHPDERGNTRNLHPNERGISRDHHPDDRGHGILSTRFVPSVQSQSTGFKLDNAQPGARNHGYRTPLRKPVLSRHHRTDKVSGNVDMGHGLVAREHSYVPSDVTDQRAQRINQALYKEWSRGGMPSPDRRQGHGTGEPRASLVSNTGMSNGQIAREPWIVDRSNSPVRGEEDADARVATVEDLVTEERQTFDQVRQHHVDRTEGAISEVRVDISGDQLAGRIHGSDDSRDHVDFLVEMHGNGGRATSRTSTTAAAAASAATTSKPTVTATNRTPVKPTASGSAGVEIQFLPLLPSLRTSGKQMARPQSVQSDNIDVKHKTLARVNRVLDPDGNKFWKAHSKWRQPPAVFTSQAQVSPKQIPHIGLPKIPQAARMQKRYPGVGWTPYYNIYNPHHHPPPGHPLYPYAYNAFYNPLPGPGNNIFRAVEVEDPTCTWKLIFKAVSGNNRHVFEEFADNDIYVNGYVDEARSIASFLPYKEPEIIRKWNELYILQVKVEIFDMGHRAAWFVFNGIASTKENWWSQDRLIASSYDNVKTDSLEAFTTYDSVSQRSFVIRQRSTDCDNTCGYVEINDAVGDTVCSYQTLRSRPYFLYSKSPSKTGCWQAKGEYGIGDRFVISAKVCKEDW